MKIVLQGVNDAPILTGTQAVPENGTEITAYTISIADLATPTSTPTTWTWPI